MEKEEMQKIVRRAIDEFFEGKDYFMNDDDYVRVGHIWSCTHVGFSTLTIEPREGGQFEVAVRLKIDGEFKGYFVDFDVEAGCFLCGKNTDGH